MRRASLLMLLLSVAPLGAQEAVIRVRADRVLHDVSRHVTGACIEDVNHEIYGGIYSQMVFGESFQEPPVAAIEGFTAHGGGWRVEEGILHAPAGDGPKLVLDGATAGAGRVSVDVRFDGDAPGLAGLILKVREAGVGADRWIGYEVSLDPGRQALVLGRHRHNWEPLREAPCAVPRGEWIPLAVTLEEAALEVEVGGTTITRLEDREHPLEPGAVGLRTWRREASFRNLATARAAEDAPRAVPFRQADPRGLGGTSGLWRPYRTGTTEGAYGIERTEPFVGRQSQRIERTGGEGDLGLENRGLNRQGMALLAERDYEGRIWLRAEAPVKVVVALESGDGSRRLASTTLEASGPWRPHDFHLRPSASEPRGRLAIGLASPGAVTVGHVFLQPGPWGRYRGLPARRDVVEGLLEGGINVLRLGGLMANAGEYRWKSMRGPRDRRQPYRGWWYPHSSNGWGIFEHLELCEAAGILPIVDVNVNEAPEDLADLVEYCLGSADTEWGARRIEDGRTAPYPLRHLELGNEEAVDEEYARKFAAIAEAVWARDPDLILIVGDFEYKRPITDPYRVEGAPRIRSLAAHRSILELARSRGREVWFDVHIWNDGPGVARDALEALPTFAGALARLSPGARFKVCILEENAVNHSMRRALAHAETIHGLLRLGDLVPVVCAANALQPDGQNDNGWDQGLLFLDPSRVWGQPPYHVTRMVSDAWLPRRVEARVEAPVEAHVEGAVPALDAIALAGNGALSVLVVNAASTRARARVRIEGLDGRENLGDLEEHVREAVVTRLSGALEERNTADDPERVVPWSRAVKVVEGEVDLDFPAHSYTTLLVSTR